MRYTPDPSEYKELLPGVFMKPLTYGEQALLCEFRLEPGAHIPLHQHPHEQSGYLVRGSLRLFGEEGEFEASPGCSWNFKGGVQHGADALTECVLIEVFTPVRQEYLQTGAA